MRMKWKVLFLFASAYIARSSRSSAETLFVLVIFIYRNDWKRTNKSIKQRNKQVMITSTNVVWRSRYSWLGDADACVYVCARCALASIAHVIALHHINIVWNRVLQLRFFFRMCVLNAHFFPITWQWHWKNSRVDFDIPVISWWHHQWKGYSSWSRKPTKKMKLNMENFSRLTTFEHITS